MRIADDGKSIEITKQEIIKLEIQGYKIIRDKDGHVIEIKSDKKDKEGKDVRNKDKKGQKD